jgi:hypothetical protein
MSKIAEINSIDLFDVQPVVRNVDIDQLTRRGYLVADSFSRPVYNRSDGSRGETIDIPLPNAGKLTSQNTLKSLVKNDPLSVDDAKKLLLIEVFNDPRASHVNILLCKICKMVNQSVIEKINQLAK